jgi:hypothetical protein
MADREQWHLSEEAVYDFVDRRLSPAARIEAERHLRACPDCTRLLRRAELLLTQLESIDPPQLDRDLAPGVVANLQTARTSSVRFRLVLAAQAVAATMAFAALSLRVESWFNALLTHSAYATLRQHSLRLVAEATAWIAPFLNFIPSYPSRLASMRVTIPHLDGPVQGWVGLAAAALVLGLVGNALLLRSAKGVVEKTVGGADDSAAPPGRIGRRSRGGRA